jgi:hypothetical protein
MLTLNGGDRSRVPTHGAYPRLRDSGHLPERLDPLRSAGRGGKTRRWTPTAAAAVRQVAGCDQRLQRRKGGLGVPIPIRYDGYPDDTDADHSDVYAVTGSTDELIDVVRLASFRCSAGRWIQCDSASASVAAKRMELYLPHHPALRDLIAEELQDRLRGAGIDATVTFLERRVND